MRVVVAVVVQGSAWRVHVDLDDGRTDLFRETACVGSAVLAEDGWTSVVSERDDAHQALAASMSELKPFAAVLRRGR